MIDVAAEHQAAHRRQAAVGHGQPVLQPALPGGSGHQPRSRGLRLRRRPGRPLPGSNPSPGWPQLRVVGRPRGLRDAAQHRHEARARPAGPLLVDGRRAQAANRLHRHDPARAEAVRADQAPVRLRRRRSARVPAEATTSPTRSRSTSRSTTPRSPVTISPTRSPPQSNAGIFGSIDANAGDDRLGWDVDRFPVSVEQMTLGMLEILRGGGFTTGGLNFDSKLRRQSSDRTDLFYAHIGGMDTMARALLAAASIVEAGDLDALRDARYAGWDEPARHVDHGRRDPRRSPHQGDVDRRADQVVRPSGDAREPRRPPHRARPLAHTMRDVRKAPAHLSSRVNCGRGRWRWFRTRPC